MSLVSVWWCQEGVWKVSRRCLEFVWKVSGIAVPTPIVSPINKVCAVSPLPVYVFSSLQLFPTPRKYVYMFFMCGVTPSKCSAFAPLDSEQNRESGNLQLARGSLVQLVCSSVALLAELVLTTIRKKKDLNKLGIQMYMIHVHVCDIRI